jgi:hypothetical protein
LLSKNITLTFERLVTKIRYEVGPSLLLGVWGFRQSCIPCIAVKKCHPHLRASGHQNPVQGWTFAFVGCVGFSAIGRSLYCCQKASPSHSSIWSSKSDTGLDLRFCWVRWVFGDRAFPIFLSKSVNLAFERLITKFWYCFWRAITEVPVCETWPGWPFDFWPTYYARATRRGYRGGLLFAIYSGLR